LANENSKLTDIKLGLTLLFKPGQLVEFRVKTAEEVWRGFYGTDHDRLAEIIRQLDDDPRVVSLYVVINPVKPNLLRERAKCDCKVCAQGGLLVDNPTSAQVEQILTGPTQHLTKNEDIDTLQNLFIDIDTYRAPHLKLDEATKPEYERLQHESSTNEEKRETFKVANKVLEYLDEKGWPQPLIADSGNGYHILPRVNSLNSIHNANLLLDCLKALANKFNCDACHIDASVFNPARLTRAYGTTTRKGTSTEERPYRRNRLMQPDRPVLEVSPDQIMALANEVPTENRRRNQGDSMPVLDPSFDPEHYFEWFRENPNAEGEFAFDIVGTREAGGVTYKITDTCLIAGHRHEGSDVTGFAIGKSFGYHCFSSDCEGTTLRDIHEKLLERGFELYPYPIFVNDGLEAILDGIEEEWIVDVLASEKADDEAFGVDAPEPVPDPESPDEVVTKVKRLKVGNLKDLATAMLGCIFRDPVKVLPKFLQSKSHIEKTILAALEVPIAEVLIIILGYFRETRQLPSKNELKNFIADSTVPTAKSARNNQFLPKILEYIDGIEDDPTKEFTVQVTELGRAVELELQRQATQANYKNFLKTGSEEDVALFRNAERKHWQNELRDKGEILSGPIQSMTEELREDFLRDVEGVKDNRKFTLGIDAIDKNSNIGLDGERTIFVYGPASNRKTTMLMTIALHAAMQNKNGLLLVGEHQGIPTMKSIALMAGHYLKDDPDIGVLPDRAGWEGLQRKATKEDFERMSLLLEKIRTREAIPGFLGVQNIDAITHGEEDRLGAVMDYIHSYNQEYPLSFVVIDPLDSVMPSSAIGRENAWLEGKDVLQRIQSLSRNFEGRDGQGLMIVTSAQFVSKMQREIEKQQAKNASQQDQFDDEIVHLLTQVSQCQFFTTIAQVLDFGIGIATRVKGGNEGYLVKGRNRFLSSFMQVPFKVDLVSNVLYESSVGTVRMAAAAAAPAGGQPEAVMTGSFDEAL
jgi:hypothetical protein